MVLQEAAAAPHEHLVFGAVQCIIIIATFPEKQHCTAADRRRSTALTLMTICTQLRDLCGGAVKYSENP